MAMFGFLATALNILYSRRSNATSKENNEVLKEVRANVNGNLVKAVNEAKDDARRNPAPRVLIIDDDATDIELAAKPLRKFGCEVYAARNSMEAEHLLMTNVGPGRGFPFDFALLDLRMPGDATEEVLRIFDEKAPRVPIVILTGDPSNPKFGSGDIPRIWIIKPLTEANVKSLLDQFSLSYPKPHALTEASQI